MRRSNVGVGVTYEVDFSLNEATGFSNPTGDTCVGPGMVSTQYYF